MSLEAGALGALQNGLACCMVCLRPALLSREAWVTLSVWIGLTAALCTSISLNEFGFGSNVCCAVLCCPAPAGGSEETRFGSGIEGLEEGDLALTTPRKKVSLATRLCVPWGVHVSLRSVPDLVGCRCETAPRVPCESLKIEFRTTGLEASPALGGDRATGSRPSFSSRAGPAIPEAMLSCCSPLQCCTPSFPVPNSSSPLEEQGRFISLGAGCLCRLKWHL